MAGPMKTRRGFLTNGLALGCSLAASPLLTPVTLASAPWENRLVVIILRGGMDGIDVVQPVGDPEFAALRATTDLSTHDLDGFFALHPSLADLMPLWNDGDLGFVHAVSTPYRDKRSHFDGQDILEAGIGTSRTGGIRDGWLNRLVQNVPDARTETAYAIGRSDMLLTRGKAQISDWSPDAGLTLSPQAQRLIETMMHDDPLFRDAVAEAIDLSADEIGQVAMETDEDVDMLGAMQSSMSGARKGDRPETIARFAAERLREDTRIAAFSLNGFDTHARQPNTLPNALKQLRTAIVTLKQELGPVWQQTAIVAMTEFGRTVRINGTRGTDHGTGGAMVMAGGAIKGGRVVTQWPGLAEVDLYERRDLMPTRDLRAHTGWVLRGLFGLDAHLLGTTVFPDVDLGDNPGLIL